ncbi:MAG: heme exporter protein CcmB [Patulibacter minatonensis]
MSRPIGSLRATWLVVRKDLLLERRTFELLPSMGLLALGTIALLRFALDQDEVSGDLAAGALLIPLLLAALLGIARLFAAEESDAGVDQFLLSPAPAGALLAAKIVGLFVVLVTLEVVLVPVFALLLLGPSIGPVLPEVVLVLLLLDAALAVIGGLVAGLAIGSRSRELLIPIMVVPFALPALISAQAALAPVLEQDPGALVTRWPAVLAIYAVILGLVGSVVAEFLVED